MKTTHTGSLPRPAGLHDLCDPAAVAAAVAENVSQQRRAGIDYISDGEASKTGYATYVTERLTGFGGEPCAEPLRGFDEFPEFAARAFGDMARAGLFANPSCNGPVSYVGRSRVNRDIANLVNAAGGADGTFMTAASPGVIALFHPRNGCYASDEEYLYALAGAMKAEYDAICAAGVVLQLDCPDLAAGWAMGPERSLAAFRAEVAMRLDVLNYATRDIPPEKLRMHLCWGNFEAPHTLDIPLAAIIDLVLSARPAALAFEAANPRHGQEWELFEDLSLPEGKTLIPGVIDTTTNFIEHPDLVAQRLRAFARCVGAENVIAGTDCGFGTFAGWAPVDARIAWGKLAALVEGTRLVSKTRRSAAAA
jgi:5-methyltetrahydropteroyltriglutamate--homocysteine methyltransferase